MNDPERTKEDFDRIIGSEGIEVHPSQCLKSSCWKCSQCKEMYVSTEPVPNPAPCVVCEGIFFETV